MKLRFVPPLSIHSSPKLLAHTSQATMISVGAARALIWKKFGPLPLELVPQVAVPYLFLYQADFGFYTKVRTLIAYRMQQSMDTACA